LVAVACFLPGQAKYLSATPRNNSNNNNNNNNLPLALQYNHTI